MTKQKHSKKKVAGSVGVVGLIVIGFSLWSDIYPVICPYVSNPVRCTEVSKALVDASKKLDAANLDGGLVLE